MINSIKETQSDDEVNAEVIATAVPSNVFPEPIPSGRLAPISHKSMTTSPFGCEQQTSRFPSAGLSRGSGW
jgi:hypothetical protein